MSKMEILQKSLIICPLTEKMNIMEKRLPLQPSLLETVACFMNCRFLYRTFTLGFSRIVFPFMIRACFVLSDKVANMAPLESAMLKFNNFLGHWNLRIGWCIPFLPIWWWYHLNVLKLWKFFPPWGLECFWSTLYQEIITIL